ncbi:ankyrin repeat domain-containing protein [Hoyosella rhizosphaerae]|uniref:Ankyrin-like protein n=1 Tax=Hoyosella rhizosphaerae TaxID=1755582 RepID=A0A916U9H8_9ACTN|nr:ankyrin repeat domain-containing protein [Hoyosella rhizosphaerae]MBN4927403.1 ankyrin repeat domain-containing protein [Hoyosella rhizosphaerae]GGC64697.1 putative ankyrin-like protein [Hoyosella rhizosphaerae]
MTQGDDDAELVEFATKLFGFARSGETENLVNYVDAGVPVNLTNENGDTLLMLASYHGHSETVSALVARGADVNRPNDRGQTPLAGAVFKGEDEVVRILVEAGANPTSGSPTALAAAHMFGRDDYLALLQQTLGE